MFLSRDDFYLAIREKHDHIRIKVAEAKEKRKKNANNPSIPK
jgi:hypothetical protein